MAKKVQINVFIRLLASGVQYTRKEIKELAKSKGYVIPGEFWDAYKVSRGKFGILEKSNKVDKYWSEDDFSVVVTKQELFCEVVVTHKVTKLRALSTCSENHIKEKSLQMMKGMAPLPKIPLEETE